MFTFFQCQVSQHRIEIDRISAAAEGIVTVKVDMLPSDRRDCLGKDECFGVFARLVFVEQPRKDGGVVKNYWGMGSRSGKSLKYQAIRITSR